MQKKILIYNSGGGLGDSIQLFPLILSLQEHYKGSEFYYLGSHENHFLGKLKEFEVKIKSLEFNLRYFGFRWWHFLVVKNYAKKLNTTFSQFSVWTPYPGTPVFKEYEDQITANRFEEFDQYNLVFKHKNLNKEIIRKYLSKAYSSYYLRIKWLTKYFKSLILS